MADYTSTCHPLPASGSLETIEDVRECKDMQFSVCSNVNCSPALLFCVFVCLCVCCAVIGLLGGEGGEQSAVSAELHLGSRSVSPEPLWKVCDVC